MLLSNPAPPQANIAAPTTRVASPAAQLRTGLPTTYAAASTGATAAAPPAGMITCVLGATNQVTQSHSARRARQSSRPAQATPRQEGLPRSTFPLLARLSEAPSALLIIILTCICHIVHTHCCNLFHFISMGAPKPLLLQRVCPYYHNSYHNCTYDRVNPFQRAPHPVHEFIAHNRPAGTVSGCGAHMVPGHANVLTPPSSIDATNLTAWQSRT